MLFAGFVVFWVNLYGYLCELSQFDLKRRKEICGFGTSDNIKTEVVSSWTDAFSIKTKFLNTSILD